jgi:hypothetical protein
MSKNPNYGVNKYGNRYRWTPLTHSELIEFIESKRILTGLSKADLSLAANYSSNVYSNLFTGNHRFSKESFRRITKAVVDSPNLEIPFPIEHQPEKIEAPVKIEKPIYGVMSIEQMITKIKAAGYKVMRRTEGWEEI